MAEAIPTSVEQLLIASSAGRGPYKLAVKAGSTVNLTLSGEQTVGGVACVENDRVLAAGQTDPKKNGIWIVKVGPWVRATDHDSDRDCTLGARVEVLNGTNKGDWHMTAPTTGTVTPNVTAQTWTKDDPASIQGPDINIGTEIDNVTIDIGNGADTVNVVANDVFLRADNQVVIGTGVENNFIVTPDVATLYTRVQAIRGLRFAANGSDGVSFECTHANGNVNLQPGSSGNIIPTRPILVGPGTTFSITQSQQTSGAGNAMSVRGQQGQAGFVGGDLILAGGLGGTGGTNSAGAVRIKGGTPVGGATAPLYLEREDGTKILTMYEIGAGTAAIYGGAAGGTSALTIRGASLGLESSSTIVAVQPATDLYLGHGSNRDIIHREVGTTVLTEHLDADGATYFRFADGPTEVAVEQVQRATTGAGRPMRIQAQRGNGGKGGDLTLASGAPGTASTHEGGDIILQLHDPIASSSGRLSVMGNATEWIGIERNPAGGNVAIQCLSYGLAIYGAGSVGVSTSGILLLSTSQSAAVSVAQGGASTNGVLLQDSTAGRRFKDTKIGSAGPITSATTTYAITLATTSNTVYHCKAYITVTNDTDNEGAFYEVKCTFKNVAGTITTIGGTASVVTNHEDTNQAGLAPVLSFSGTNILVGLQTDSTDTVHFNAVLEVYERVLV